MLGMVGFLSLVLAVGAYALTSLSGYRLVPLRTRRLFVSGYSLLALSALVWALTFVVPESAIAGLVFMTDIMLVVASVAMLAIVVDVTRPVIMLPVTVIAAGLLTFRAFVMPSDALIDGGILYLNLGQWIAGFIGLVFLALWLPATIRVVNVAFATPALQALRNVILYLFMATILMASFFLAARRPAIVIITFVSVIGFFLVLTGLNILLIRTSHTQKVRDRHG